MRRFITFILAITSLTAYPQNANNLDSTLREIYKKDQEIRKEVIPDFQSGSQERLLIAHYKMQKVDSINQNVVFKILDQYGWPKELSDTACSAIFLVVDHAELESQQKYLPLIKQAANEGALSKSDCATLEDRILMRLNKPQIYGTQTQMFMVNEKGSENYMWPIKDADNVDKRRAEIGLPPLDQYLEILEKSGFKTTWDKSLTPKKLLNKFNIKRSK